MPGMIRNGSLYLAMPPLYRIGHGKDVYYAKDDAHRAQILEKHFKNKKPEIGRFKGLGEMMPAQLKETTMDPKTRTLARVTLPHDEEDIESLVETLMGRKPGVALPLHPGSRRVRAAKTWTYNGNGMRHAGYPIWLFCASGRAVRQRRTGPRAIPDHRRPPALCRDGSRGRGHQWRRACPDRTLGTLAAEASGRRAVRLDQPGQYVEFTLTRPANAVDIRYSVPDTPDGKGLDATLSLYVTA